MYEGLLANSKGAAAQEQVKGGRQQAASLKQEKSFPQLLFGRELFASLLEVRSSKKQQEVEQEKVAIYNTCCACSQPRRHQHHGDLAYPKKQEQRYPKSEVTAMIVNYRQVTRD